MVRRVGHFEVLFIQRYQDGERFFTVKLKIFTVREICHQRITRNRRAMPKTFVYTRVANLGDFSPKKANLGSLLKNVLGIIL
jgi:hypothetical protein